MATPNPIWEEYDSGEDTDTETETETETEEDDGENKDDQFQEKEKFNSEKEDENWLTSFFKRSYEISPIEVQPPQRNGWKENDQKELDYDKEGDQRLSDYTQRNGFKQTDIKESDYDKEEEENIPNHSEELNPFFEDEQEHNIENGGEEKYFKKSSEDIDNNEKEYNNNELDSTVEEYEHITDFSKHPLFREKDKENELYLSSDEEDSTINPEDTDLLEEEEDDIREEDIKFDYNDYPEEKPIPFGEDKPDVIDPEFLELVDGKDGEPDPNTFAPLDLLDGVQIGDKRWKEMMEQIMYTSPYEDYVPLENKPPQEAIWEKWERTDFNEGRWVDDLEFDDPNVPSDFTVDMEEIKKLAKLMQEGKPLPYSSY